MKILSRLLGFALLAFVVLNFQNQVQAQYVAQNNDLGPVLDRLERMERDIRTMNTRMARGDASPQAAPAASGVSGTPATQAEMVGPATDRIYQRLANMEDDIRASTGRMEELGYRLDQLGQRLEKLIGDVDYRLGELEKRPLAGPGAQPTDPRVSAAPSPPSVQKVIPGAPGGGLASTPTNLGAITEADLKAMKPGQQAPTRPSVASAAPDPQPAPDPKAAQLAAYANVLPKGTVKDRYNYAIGLLRKTDYPGAETALRAFLAVHEKNPLSKNARYWLGETFYVRGEFAEAADIFLQAYQADPKGSKAPDSLLKLGMSLSSLEKKPEACAAFGKLKKDFSKIPTALKTTLERQSQRNGCK